MPLLLYLFKMSVSLSLLYLFYQAFLRPLTLYSWNRFCLIFYCLLSFVIPFINISPWVEEQKSVTLFRLIPVIGKPVAANAGTSGYPLAYGSVFAVLSVLFAAGAGIALLRVLLQYVSLLRIRRGARLANRVDHIGLFETNAPVSPFSFGQAIFYNRSLHTAAELEQILVHEIVHVKEQHSWDLLLAELICIVNWFNPFAWLIRRSIRQNLEFIADSRVLASGLNKKDYQYLLLKVVGMPQYRIAGNFNFTNLKKRIIMMNKNESHRSSAARVLFSLPILLLLLCAFRGTRQRAGSIQPAGHPVIYDTVPVPPPPPAAVMVPPPPPPAKKGSGATKQGKHPVPLPPPVNPATPPPPPPVDPAKALYVVNGVVQPASAAPVDPQLIQEMNVLKGKSATDKYGPAAAAGAIEILLKPGTSLPAPPPVHIGQKTAPGQAPHSLPADVLIIVDGKDMPAGYDPNVSLKPENIERVNVYKGKDAFIKFGDKGKNGVVEIISKPGVHA